MPAHPLEIFLTLERAGSHAYNAPADLSLQQVGAAAVCPIGTRKIQRAG